MREAKPGRFSQLGAGPLARAADLFAMLNERMGMGDLVASVLVAGAVVLMIDSRFSAPRIPVLKEGELAPFTIRAPRTLEIEDEEAFAHEKAQTLSHVPDVYDFDSKAIASLVDRWKQSIQYMRQNRAAHRSASEGAKLLSTKLGVPVSADEYRALARLEFSLDLERSAVLSFAPLWDRQIVQTHGTVEAGAELVDIHTSKTVRLRPKEFETMMTLEEAANEVGRAAKTIPRGRVGNLRAPWERWAASTRASVFAFQARLLAPNVTLNRKETEARRMDAAKALRPVFQKLERGEVVVREGERLTKREAQLLAGMNRVSRKDSDSGAEWPQVCFGTFTIWLILFFVRRQFPIVLRNAKDSMVAGGFLVCSLACFKLSLVFQLSILSESSLSVPEVFLIFMIPIAAPSMTLRLLVDAPLTILFSFFYALGASLIVGKAGLFGIYLFLSCLVGPMLVARCKTRSSLYRAGMWTALVGGIGAVFLVAAWDGHIPFSGAGLSGDLKESGDYALPLPALLVWSFLGGCVGGWLSSALTLVLTPLFENLLDYTTDLKLLELARMDHPLLRELVLKAPGTYHHSIIVGSLVEAGAEAIGANSLLARVGSYYHDIGKIGRAEYFVENQAGGRNPHDQTTPQLSAKIIISHVKEGKALAEEYKLGKAIARFIETHHGTGLVNYFYNKAKQEAAQPDSTVNPDEISEEEFRYPGPKPATREEAILALADSCEAATRSLVDPTPARLEGMVNKIVQKAYTEGLLDEADITLAEVHAAGKAFLRILLGIHHNRIQYPDQEKGLPPRPVSLVRAK